MEVILQLLLEIRLIELSVGAAWATSDALGAARGDSKRPLHGVVAFGGVRREALKPTAVYQHFFNFDAIKRT